MKKIKGSLSKPAPASLVALAALSLCVLLPLRVYQATSIIDPKTGFFTEDSFTVPLFYALGAVVILALMLLSFLNDKANRTRDCVVKSKALGVISIITAVSVMYNSVVSAIRFLEISGEYSMLIHGTKFTTYLTQSGAAALILETVFGMVTAFFFCIYAVSCFSKTKDLSSFRLLSIAPVIWAICRIVYRFIEKISFVNVSDLLLELVMLVFLIMFLLAFAQIVTDSSSKENSKIFAWRLYGCGLPAALTAFLICVPKVFLVLTGHPELIVEGYGIEICDLALAVFIPVFLYNTATAKKSA